MKQSHKILKIASIDIPLQKKLCADLGISPVLAQILINRHIIDSSAAQKFLDAGSQDLLDGALFKDMAKAVGLVNIAAAAGKKVMVFGDYDADGITALALVKETLERMGIKALHYLPHRLNEGYGLNKSAVRRAVEDGVGLLITVDCGITSHEEIEELRRHNIEVIVTDHHEPADTTLPPASAIINPKVKDSGYKFKDLAGVGVAYKFCQALSNSKMFDDLDIVCLGTIADSVPLCGENRVIAKVGLLRLARTRRAGIRALIENAGISGKPFNPESVSFILAPRINASGRMDTAEVSLRLLLCSQKEEASKLAGVLDAHNRQRQKIESKIMEEALELLDRDFDQKLHKIIVIAKDDWHRGVLGIVASKLADRFYRPAIVISMGKDQCKGSGRSIKNFHLFEALLECRRFLSAFGGHAHAVGLTMDKNNIENFKESILRTAADKLLLEDMLPSLDIDLELSLADINDGMIAELDKLQPYGQGNPEALFYTRGLKLKGQPQSLRRDTLKFRVSNGDVTMQVIGFGMAPLMPSLEAADSLDLVYSARMDNWQGDSSLILEAKDMFFR
ncbi:MAG: single-stranded-DNA-specific exonuclease RecJ [Candidatus Omnitrophota bacterium]|nr:single-stranded-DNA-specific exonuclease RecJ [Candidatus Omnitrophota bacterium]